jgi:hypothetical protein
MPETKFGPLESLVGRTFEKDGNRLTVALVRAPEEHYSPDVEHVFAIDGFGRRGEIWLEAFLRFLSGAEEVKT